MEIPTLEYYDIKFSIAFQQLWSVSTAVEKVGFKVQGKIYGLF